MLRVKVDRAEPTELHEQVAAEIRRAIAEGEAKPVRFAREHGYRLDELVRIIENVS